MWCWVQPRAGAPAPSVRECGGARADPPTASCAAVCVRGRHTSESGSGCGVGPGQTHQQPVVLLVRPGQAHQQPVREVECAREGHELPECERERESRPRPARGQGGRTMRLATGMFAPIQIPSHSFRLSATQARRGLASVSHNSCFVQSRAIGASLLYSVAPPAYAFIAPVSQTCVTAKWLLA